MEAFTALRNWRAILTETIGYAEDLGQLASVELAAVQHRLVRRVVALVFAMLSFACGFLFVGVAVVIAFWEHGARGWIAAGVALMYFAIAAALVMIAKPAARAFDRTRRELEGTLQWLKTKL